MFSLANTFSCTMQSIQLTINETTATTANGFLPRFPVSPSFQVVLVCVWIHLVSAALCPPPPHTHTHKWTQYDWKSLVETRSRDNEPWSDVTSDQHLCVQPLTENRPSDTALMASLGQRNAEADTPGPQPNHAYEFVLEDAAGWSVNDKHHFSADSSSCSNPSRAPPPLPRPICVFNS